MKSSLLLTGMLLAAANFAAATPAIPATPDICDSVANYAAVGLQMAFSDGTWMDVYDPASVRLTRDLNKYPFKKTFLGNCDEDAGKLKDSWCQVAGGSPDVYQYDISEKDGNDTYPIATVIVTYNRGGCWVDEASRD